MIESISDLQDLVKQGKTEFKQYGHVKTVLHDDMILFNYVSKAVFENRWNYLERISRGLILDRNTGKVVARPFERFENWGAHGKTGTGRITLVTEKLDGSLIVHNDNVTATRGSFTSDQAIWAKEYIKKNHPDLTVPSDMTLMFEAIYPENRIVVDYHGEESLVLLAARNNINGEYASRGWLSWFAETNELLLCDAWDMGDSIDDITAAANSHSGLDNEGYVIHMSDGSMWKIKGQDYVRLHKAISNLSFKNAARDVRDGKVEETLSIIPDEFLDAYHDWVSRVGNTVDCIVMIVGRRYALASKSSRKEFALWATNDDNKEYAPYLFKLYDRKDFIDLIYKKEYGV